MTFTKYVGSILKIQFLLHISRQLLSNANKFHTSIYSDVIHYSLVNYCINIIDEIKKLGQRQTGSGT